MFIEGHREGHCVIMEIYIDEMIMNIMELENSSSHFHNKKGNLSSSLGHFFVPYHLLQGNTNRQYGDEDADMKNR